MHQVSPQGWRVERFLWSCCLIHGSHPFLFFFNTVFKDKNTPSPFIETFPEDDEAAKASKPDHIYMDAMGFGMGNCCLQVLAHRQRRVPSPTSL